MPGAAIAGAGALFSAYGQHRAAKKQRGYLRNAAGQMSPEAIMAGARQLNPWLFNALNQADLYQTPTFGNTGDYLDYQSSMSSPGSYTDNLAQLAHTPGYIDPRTMNYGIQQSMLGADAGFQQASSMVGRSGLEGGMADAYTFAHEANKSQIGAQAYQQYNLAREEKRRSDVALIQGMISQSQQAASGNAQARANILSQQQAGPNAFSMLGQGAATGLQAYGAFKDWQSSRQTGGQPKSPVANVPGTGGGLNAGLNPGQASFSTQPLQTRNVRLGG